VEVGGGPPPGLVELKTGKTISRQNPLKVDLPAYGFRLYKAM
jgi:hypothetical protein